jgi:hypothetical protein
MSGFPTGYSQAAAIAMVQLRTNSQFGQPTAPQIVMLLNAGVEQLGLKTEPVLVNTSIPITVANTNVLTLPADLQRVRNMNYSTGPLTSPGTVAYEMVELPYDEFIEQTDATPAGGLGGIPTIYTITQDSSNVMVIQLYPLVSSGQVNIFYYQRPQLWSTNTSTGGATTTTVDSAFQEPVMLWTCARIMEAREDIERAKYFMDQYREAMTEARADVFRRRRKNQSNTVRNVAEGEAVTPTWIR